MTRAALKEYLIYHARQLSSRASNGALVSFPMDKIDDFINSVIDAGFAEFWGARAWPFRRVSYTIPVTVSANPYTLPSDFMAFFSIVDQTTGRGRQIPYRSKSEFDMMFPNPSVIGGNNPVAFTVSKEQGANTWSLYFAPIPAVGQVLKSVYLTKTPAGIELIDDEYISGVIAACTKKLFAPNSKDYAAAVAACRAEYDRLETIPAFSSGMQTTADADNVTYTSWTPFQ